MSDNKTAPSDLDLLIASINDLAREIGEMEPDDPVRAVRLKELYTLTELSTSLKTEGNKIIDKRIETVRR
jgi:tRNA A37 N6-isopentenylltransferase MiaA